MSEHSASAENEALSQRVHELELMMAVSRRLTSTLDLDRLLRLISETAAELANCVDASIILEEQRTGELMFLAASGPKSEQLKKIRVPIEGSIAGTVFKSRQPLIVQNTEADPRHYSGVDRIIEFDTQSILAIPMVFRERVIGVLEAVNKQGGAAFDQHDVQILSTLASHAAVAIENAHLVAELQEANARMAELDRLKSDFISIASHELRTPLHLVLGYAALLREEAGGESGEQLGIVLQAATKLKELIDDMVNLSHLQAGSATLNLSEFCLQEVIQECIEAQEQYAARKALEIRQSVPAAAVHVHADREKIGIILSNLLDNAIQFTPPGGRIHVALRPQTEMVAVSVSDTGIGVPQDQLDLIFDRFYQVEPPLTRHVGGMGLGLSIARGMAELHGGHLWAESVEGHGSRFTFTLPIAWSNAVPAQN